MMIVQPQLPMKLYIQDSSLKSGCARIVSMP